MKEKKAKLKLEDVKVESFVTTLDDKKSNNVVGQTGTLCKTCGSKVICCLPTDIITCPD
jgi:hypothetical protein